MCLGDRKGGFYYHFPPSLRISGGKNPILLNPHINLFLLWEKNKKIWCFLPITKIQLHKKRTPSLRNSVCAPVCWLAGSGERLLIFPVRHECGIGGQESSLPAISVWVPRRVRFLPWCFQSRGFVAGSASLRPGEAGTRSFGGGHIVWGHLTISQCILGY